MTKLAHWISWLGAGVFISGLAVFAWLGFYNRFWADDWCYNADLVSYGFWGTLQGYTFITHYASNRYSLTFFTLLMQLWGVFSAQLTALLMVLSWFGGLFLLLWALDRLFGLKIKLAILVLAGLAIEYYSLYLAPNQFRSVFFRSSVLTYTAPLIFALYVFGLLVWQMTRQRPSRLLAWAMAPLTFIAAGFSEGGCAYLGAALGLLWLAVLFYRRAGRDWAVRVFGAATIALVSALVATFVLILSPAIAPRHVGYPDPMSPLMVPVLSVLFSLDFIQSSIRALILPHLVFGLLFLLLPFLATLTGFGLNLPLSKSLKAIGLIVIVAVLLIAACQVPAIFIQRAPPDSKGLIAARFTLLLALAAIFWLAGSWLAARTSPRLMPLMLVLVLVPMLYTLRPIAATYADLPRFVDRAAVWDQRDQSIRAAKASGILQIEVRSIDSKYMGQTLDLKDKPTFWTNACAETYYGMDEIRANLP